MKQCLHSLSWKCLFVLAFTLCLYSTSFSQDEAKNFTEFGFTTGPIVALTDLGGHAGKGTTFIKDYKFQNTQLAFGAFLAVYPTPWLGFRFSANYGNVASCDCDIKEKGGDENTRFARNLDFRSMILEGTAMVEFYPTVFLEDDPEDVAGRLRPYGVLGLGLYHFNPQGSLQVGGNTEWYDLRPLHTEGEGWIAGSKEYSLTHRVVTKAGIGTNDARGLIDRGFLFIKRFLQKKFALTRATVIGLHLVADVELFTGNQLVEILELGLNSQNLRKLGAILAHGVRV